MGRVVVDDQAVDGTAQIVSPSSPPSLRVDGRADLCRGRAYTQGRTEQEATGPSYRLADAATPRTESTFL